MLSFFVGLFALTSNLFAYDSLVELEKRDDGLLLTTLYGTVTITEPVLIECIEHHTFERLKKIRQYGVMCHARSSEPEYTRWQHSLGVFFITRKYGTSLEEQIAALEHDLSHTCFSHVGDALFKSNYRTGKCSYQDEIHEQYLNITGVTALLEKHGFAHACDHTTKDTHRCFDQPLPGLCADRIEYNLTGAYIDGLITHEELTRVISALHYENGEWFFDNYGAAKQFGKISLALSETRWGAPWSAFIDHTTAQALRRACEIGLITYDDIHYSTDDYVWQKLITSDDTEIVHLLLRIKNFHDYFAPCANGTIHIRGKFSGTDPLVKTESGLTRLSAIDPEYSAEFNRVKKLVTEGCWIN